MLTFIGVCTVYIAGGGIFSGRLLFVLAVVLLATAGANGLTNYIDRDIDARMLRTRNRALPSKRICPPGKVLPLIAVLIIAGLFLSWLLHPYVFIADIVGTVAAATWRKRVTCVYPQGAIASGAPVAMGWLALNPVLSWTLILLLFVVALWLPLHVWSLMIAHREVYLQAGINYFPVNYDTRAVAKIILVFSMALHATSVALYFVGGFGWLYLTLANLLGIIMVYAGWRLIISNANKDALRVYKLSSFPYLGMIFLVICLDIWLLK